MLSTFSCACWPSVFFGKMSIQVSCPFFSPVGFFFFFLYWVVWGIHIFWIINSILVIPFTNIFSHSVGCLFKNNFFYLFIFGCVGFSSLCGLFSSCREQELLASCSVRASHCRGVSCCGAQVLGHMGFNGCLFTGLFYSAYCFLGSSMWLLVSEFASFLKAE